MFPIVSRAKLFARAKLFSGKTAAAALVAASTLAVAAAPTAANAGGWHKHHHKHYGYGAAALGGGLLLGAIIASDRARARAYVRGYDRECWVERRKRVNAYGEVFFKKVRVCD
jgi:hypothetical protein